MITPPLRDIQQTPLNAPSRSNWGWPRRIRNALDGMSLVASQSAGPARARRRRATGGEALGRC
eukprot:2487903-Pyramimonas_sp.AAC.1